MSDKTDMPNGAPCVLSTGESKEAYVVTTQLRTRNSTEILVEDREKLPCRH